MLNVIHSDLIVRKNRNR